jgi:hypothetical protein
MSVAVYTSTYAIWTMALLKWAEKQQRYIYIRWSPNKNIINERYTVWLIYGGSILVA